jgi:hypothetical protein
MHGILWECDVSVAVQSTLIIVAQAAILFTFLRLLPSSILKFAEKEIERRSDIKLEKIKGEIQGTYSTLTSSVDMLTASNTGLHPHIIEAVSSLWGLIVQMKHNFSGMITFDSLFLATEADIAFSDEGKNRHMIAFVEAHKNELENLAANGALLEANLDKHRLFCGDRLWLIFFVIRATYMRNSLLISRSF